MWYFCILACLRWHGSRVIYFAFISLWFKKPSQVMWSKIPHIIFVAESKDFNDWKSVTKFQSMLLCSCCVIVVLHSCVVFKIFKFKVLPIFYIWYASFRIGNSSKLFPQFSNLIFPKTIQFIYYLAHQNL